MAIISTPTTRVPVTTTGVLVTSFTVNNIIPFQGMDLTIATTRAPISSSYFARMPLNGGTLAPAKGGTATGGGGTIVTYFWS